LVKQNNHLPRVKNTGIDSRVQKLQLNA